jgi:DNA-binding transcriptional regulator GbsR (MarR family)
MDQMGRKGFQEVVEARIAEWQRNINNLGTKMAKAKEDQDLQARMEDMKSRIPFLTDSLAKIAEVGDEEWPRLKADLDMTFEKLAWLQGYVLRRLGA